MQRAHDAELQRPTTPGPSSPTSRTSVDWNSVNARKLDLPLVVKYYEKIFWPSFDISLYAIDEVRELVRHDAQFFP
ncbi:unnamed protein product [Sphagnum jensenii]